MRTGALPLVSWGLIGAAVSLLGATVFGLGVLPAGLLAGAGLSAAATGVLVGVTGRGSDAPGPRGPRVSVSSSAATVVLVVGIVTTFVGSVFGDAFLFPGAGLALAGAGGIARERLAARRMLEDDRR